VHLIGYLKRNMYRGFEGAQCLNFRDRTSTKCNMLYSYTLKMEHYAPPKRW